MNWRCFCVEASKRASKLLSVVASRPSASAEGDTSRRRLRSETEISAVWARSTSTGRKACPVSSQATPVSAATAIGTPMASPLVSLARLLSTSSVSTAAYTVIGVLGVPAWMATARHVPFSLWGGCCTLRACGSCDAVGAKVKTLRLPSRFGELDRTVPLLSTTWAVMSRSPVEGSLAWRFPELTISATAWARCQAVWSSPLMRLVRSQATNITAAPASATVVTNAAAAVSRSRSDRRPHQAQERAGHRVTGPCRAVGSRCRGWCRSTGGRRARRSCAANSRCKPRRCWRRRRSSRPTRG